jgi:hypothetical protein
MHPLIYIFISPSAESCISPLESSISSTPNIQIRAREFRPEAKGDEVCAYEITNIRVRHAEEGSWIRPTLSLCPHEATQAEAQVPASGDAVTAWTVVDGGEAAIQAKVEN